MLHTLLKLQVYFPAHEVNEDLQVVLGLDARGKGPSVSTAHLVTTAPPLPPVENFVTEIFLFGSVRSSRSHNVRSFVQFKLV